MADQESAKLGVEILWREGFGERRIFGRILGVGHNDDSICLAFMPEVSHGINLPSHTTIGLFVGGRCIALCGPGPTKSAINTYRRAPNGLHRTWISGSYAEEFRSFLADKALGAVS